MYFQKEIEYKGLKFTFKALSEEATPADQFELESEVQRVVNEFNNGNEASWFVAVIEFNGYEAFLGCCSYKSFEEFLDEKKGYFTDLCDEALKGYLDEKAEQYIDREVYVCVSHLVSDIQSLGDESLEVYQEFNLFENDSFLRAFNRDEYVEVLEYWMVSDWLADKLLEQKEIVLKNNYGNFWGRTVSGQAITLDGTFQDIAWEVASE